MIPADAFATFDRQDSGCVSYGVERNGRRIFVKRSTTPASRRSLRRAVEFHAQVRHQAIVRPIESVDTGDEVLIIYPWRNGVVLNQATVDGSDRAGLERFRSRPSGERRAAVDMILDAHLAVAAAGFVSVDLYDGCFLYDVDTATMHLIDLDEYRRGPFVNEVGRLPGSTRYMAPEEFQVGGVIDERTTVFHLGQTIVELLDGQLSDAELTVVDTAISPSPPARFDCVRQLVDAWRVGG